MNTSTNSEITQKIDDDIIYHYCNADAFVNILTRGRQQLWLSSLKSTNDHLEGAIVEEAILEKIKVSYRNDPDLTSVAGSFITRLQMVNAFGMCFSKNGDLLSQWRAYAGDGAGFAIGFSRTKLTEILSNYKHQLYISLIDVVYSDSDLLDRFARLFIDDLTKIKHVNRKPHLPLSSEQETITTKLANQLYSSNFSVKHKGFKEENEVRILLLPPTESVLEDLSLKHRSFSNRIAPYCEFSFGSIANELIRKVVLGPKNPNRVNDVKFFLKLNGYSNVIESGQILTSSISYR